jgi:hypothetical protein
MNLSDLDSRKYFISVGAFLAVLFALLGPQGSTNLGLAARLLQWTLQVAIPLSLLIGTHLLLSRISAFDRLNPWIKLSISGVFGSMLFAPLALTLDFIFGVDDWSQVHTLNQLYLLLLDETLGVLFPVTLVWLGINAPRVLGLDFSKPGTNLATSQEHVAEEDNKERREGLWNLLPDEIGSDVLYLMSELHYLRVVTTRGSTLVLYNLSDAISELPLDSGLQPHRSYWVAKKHISKLHKHDGKSYLQLSDGKQVPVSRRRLSVVKTEIKRAVPRLQTGQVFEQRLH